MRILRCYLPSFLDPSTAAGGFASISVTGDRCWLRCDHCRALILKRMVPATTPERLAQVGRRLVEAGYVGCLISGGCLPDGRVPLLEFAGAIAELKQLGLRVVVHTGLVDRSTARGLAKARIDAALLDVIGCRATLRRVYHLNASPSDFERSMLRLEQEGVPFVPHVVLGLDYGRIRGELRAVRMVSRRRAKALVLVVLTPLRGTPMEAVKPPPIEQVAAIFSEARSLMGDRPVILGCIRPRGYYGLRVERLAISSGFHGIALPSDVTLRACRNVGVEVRLSRVCCALAYQELT